MSFKQNIIKERLDIQITSEGSVKKGEFRVDSNAKHLYGIALTSDNEQQVYYRGSQKIQLNDRELFPEDFESKLLMSGLSVPPNQRVVKTGIIPVGNGRIEVWYKDNPHPSTAFQPYRVTFYFFSRA